MVAFDARCVELIKVVDAELGVWLLSTTASLGSFAVSGEMGRLPSPPGRSVPGRDQPSGSGSKVTL